MNNIPNNNNSSSESIKCVVRCRPLNSKEKDLGIKCISISPDSKVVFVENKHDKNQPNKGKYAMDKVFDENVSQEEIFKEVGEPILTNFIGGYNCTIFCYGQTGAGKTHTMMGPLDQLFEESSDSHGIIPRIIHFLFNEKEKVIDLITNNTTIKCKDITYKIKTCVMEIYQEQIIDLLNPATNTNPNFNLYSTNNNNKKDQNELKIKEDPKKGMYIQGITEEEIQTSKQAKNLILTGLKSRHVAATEMNAESSRSHLLFSLYLNAEYTNSKNAKIKKSSRLHLIDLAGSERQKKTKAQGDRIKEACMINKSLSTLGNVINALVEVGEGKGKYVPFRDSKLTYFLKDSLGGNSKTTIVANISSSLMQVGETISTLKFVQRAKMIKNSVSLNVSVQDNIESLQEEIKKLKAIIAKGGYFDLSLLDEDNVIKKKEEYICPICHNKPIEVSQQQAMNELKNEIIDLTNSIVNNFSFGEDLKKHLMSLDSEFGKNGFKFFDMVEQYKHEYQRQLNNLGGQIKLLNEFYEQAKDGINETNKKINEYKPSDPMDSLTFEKVNNLNNSTTEIIKTFKNLDIKELDQLKMENETIKRENEISKEIKKILENQKKEQNSKKLSEKEKIITQAVDKFIKSNEDIKNFMGQHFLGQPMLKNELIFLEKPKYDLLLFQLDEEKMMNNSLKKRIEDMESENYLINLEFSKIKSQLDKFKKNKSLGKLNLKNTNTQKNALVSPFKMRLNARKSMMLNTNKNKINIIDLKNCDSDEENDSGKEITTKKATFAPPDKKNTISNKLAEEIIKMKESLDDLNNDLEEKMMANDELNEKIEELEEEIDKLNMNLETERRSNEESKEQIESLYTQIELYENKIEELAKFKNNTEICIEELFKENDDSFIKLDSLIKASKDIFDAQKEECFNLFNKNKNYYSLIESLKIEIKQKDNIINQLKKKCNTYDEMFNENNNIIKELIISCNDNNNNINISFNDFNHELDNVKYIVNSYKNRKNHEINQIIINTTEQINNLSLINNKIEGLYGKMNETIDDLIKNVKMKDNIIINLKKELLKKNNLINSYSSFESDINNSLDEIISKLSNNNIKIANMDKIYQNDLSKINNFYNNIILSQNKNIIQLIASNELDINEIFNMISRNEEQINSLIEKHNKLNEIYFNKSLSLLNVVKNDNIISKSLNEKIKDLINEKNKFGKKYDLLLEEKQSTEEKNNQLKLILNENNTQINSLKENIFKTNAELKIKEEEIKTAKDNLNLKINEYQNKYDILNKNLESKNNLIKSLQDAINNHNFEIDKLNLKISELLKEIEELKKQSMYFKIKEQEKTEQINQLNQKISSLLNEFKENKNDLLNQINQKEEKIFQLEKNNKEIQNEYINEKNKNKSLINENKKMMEEINDFNEDIKNKNLALESNEKKINSLNNKLKIQKNLILYLNKIWIRNINFNYYKKPKIANEQKKLIDNSKFEVDIIKKFNNSLFKEKLELEESQVKLNMKYNLTKMMMNLGSKILDEFNIYIEKNEKDYSQMDEIIDIFINDKIQKCKEEILIIQNKISKRLNEKKIINIQLLNKLKSYKDDFINKYNENVLNWNECLKIFHENEGIDNGKENKNLYQIIREIIEEYKESKILQLTLNSKENIGIDIIELKDIINNIKYLGKNKREMINDLIPVIEKSLNILKSIELNTEQQIKYYEFKHQIEINNNYNENSDIKNFLDEYNSLKTVISQTKNKFNNLYQEFILFQEKLENDEYLFNNEIEEELNFNNYINQNGNEFNDLNNTSDETNIDEDDIDNKEIINKINRLKSDISYKKSFLHGIPKGVTDKNGLTKYLNIYNICKNSDINIFYYKHEKDINDIISNRDIILKDINKLKTELLILNTLPNQYQINKVFLINKHHEEKISKLEQILRLILGENFNIKNIYNNSSPQIIWNESEIPKLGKDIMLLREEKNKIEKDLNTIKTAFDLALKGEGNNCNIKILFQIKEENKKLKIEIQKIKEKNKILKNKLKEINDNMILNDDIFEFNNNIYPNDSFLKSHKSNSKLKECDINLSIIKQKLLFPNNKDNLNINDLGNGNTVEKKKKKRYCSVEK